jgi:hypothetical protein
LKRILLTGAAVAGLFTAGITTAASAAATPPTTKTVTATAKCKVRLTTQATPGQIAVTAGGDSGNQFGKQSCGKPIGAGLTHATFSLADSGDLSGSIQHYFTSGQVFGTYTMSPTSTGTFSFGSAEFEGTVTIKGGTGALKGATGTGTIDCTTNDSVHYSCTEKLKLSQTVKVAAAA